MNDTPHQVAQRPPRLSRFKLVPFGLLMLAVVAATVVGQVEERSDQTTERATVSATPSNERRTSLPRVCTPPLQQRLGNREPWVGKARKRSERAFTRRLAAEQPAYVVGKNGWLFWNDWQVNDMSQSVGRVALDDAGIRRWTSYLKRLQREAARNGSKFYVAVAPAKWDVYPQLMPSWARKLRGSVSLDLLMQASPELPFIDVRPALRRTKAKTYEPLDSHWTPYGGHVAWKAIARCLRKDTGNKDFGTPRTSGVDRVASSNEFAPQGIEPRDEPMRTVPQYLEPLPAMSVRSVKTGETLQVGADNSVDASLTPVTTRTTGARTDLRLLALRDSTGGALSPLWAANFAATAQYSHGLGGTGDVPDVAKLVRKHRADVTMIVLTERYLGYEPPA